jgi:hypothetical protein
MAFEELTMLRVIGMIFGLSLFLFVFSRFRRGYARRSDLLLGISLSAGLVAVSANPNVINTVRDMFFLVPTQFDRLLILLIASNFLLWYLVLSGRMAQAWQHSQFDRLVRSMIYADFRTKYRDAIETPRILVVIPAFNEAENIRPVLEKMNKTVLGESMAVVMVDDGSNDNSVEIVDDLGFLVAISPINRGGGAALRAGYDIAQALGAEIVVTMDADGQHDPLEIERLVKPILADQADFVLGSRILGSRESDSHVRLVGIHLFNFVLRVLTGVRFTDCSNGFRAFRVKSLMETTLRQDQFHTSELIIEAVKKGGRIVEVPVTVNRRLHGTSKKGKNFSYGLNFARTIIHTWLR